MLVIARFSECKILPLLFSYFRDFPKQSQAGYCRKHDTTTDVFQPLISCWREGILAVVVAFVLQSRLAYEIRKQAAGLIGFD
jgi:hypothetical protein